MRGLNVVVIIGVRAKARATQRESLMTLLYAGNWQYGKWSCARPIGELRAGSLHSGSW